MKQGKAFYFLVALLLAVAMLAGCAAESASQPASSAPIASSASQPASSGVVTLDMAGREIKLDAPAQKVVALTASDCEILFALGAGNTLVGRGEYCNYPPEVLEVDAIQSGNETNIEQVIALQPDVVIMATMAQTTEQIKALEDAGIAVVVSDAQSIEGVYTAIELIGAIVGKTEEAAGLVQQMKDGFEQVRQSVPADAEEKTVYFEVSPLEYGLWTAGAGTFMDEIAAMLKLENIFADVDGWAEVSEEQVLERNPDYIITTTMYFGEGPLPVDEVKGRTGWQTVTAVQQNQVFNADNDEITRPGPRLVNAAQALCDFVYGT